MRRTALIVSAVFLTALAALATGCSRSVPTESSAAPPLVVCGTTLWAGAAGAPIADLSTRSFTFTALSPPGRIYLRVAHGCVRGAEVRFPPGAAVVAKRAAARVGLAAIALVPRRSRFDVTVVHPDGTRTVARVRLAARHHQHHVVGQGRK